MAAGHRRGRVRARHTWAPTTASRSSTSRATSAPSTRSCGPPRTPRPASTTCATSSPAATPTSRARSSGAWSFLDGERPGTVIFLTDGLPTVGIEEADGILELAEEAAPERTQLFAFGVGYDVDTVLLDALASTFVGSSHYVAPGGGHRDRGRAALRAGLDAGPLRRPDQPSTAWRRTTSRPAELPGIFAGNQALLTGRYDGRRRGHRHRDRQLGGRPGGVRLRRRLPRARRRGPGHRPALGAAARGRPADRAAHRGRPRLAHRGDRRDRHPVRHRDPLHRLPRRGARHGLPRRRAAFDAVTTQSEALAAAPAAGKDAVERAEALDEPARGPGSSLGGQGSQVAGRPHLLPRRRAPGLATTSSPAPRPPRSRSARPSSWPSSPTHPRSPRRPRSASASRPSARTAGSPSSGRRSNAAS